MKKFKVEKIDTFSGHQDCVYALAESSEPGKFYSAAGDGFVVEWNQAIPDLGVPIARVHNSIYAVELHRNSGQLWVGHNFDGIHVINPRKKAAEHSLKLSKSAIFDIKFYEEIALVGSGDGIVSIIDVPNLAFKRHLKASDKSVRTIAINARTKEFAVGYSDHKIRVFSLQDFTLKYVLIGHINSVFTLRYTTDGNLLVSGSRDAKLISWDVNNSYAQLQLVNAHLFAINDLALSPAGDLFATCSMDKSIKIWDAQTLQLLKVIDRGRYAGHGTSINRLLWTNFHNQLLACSDDRTISAWEISEITC